MARVNDFRDFDAFNASRAFVRERGLLVRTPSFVPNRSLANQMEPAAISVLSNFAEGYERDGNAEFIQFVSVSKGSVGELRAQLIYSLDVGLIPESRYQELDTLGISAARMLGGLNRYLSDQKGAVENLTVGASPTCNLQLVTRNPQPLVREQREKKNQCTPKNADSAQRSPAKKRFRDPADLVS
jgi:four helix bundle protein